MKKGLIFSITYFPNVGGAEIAVKEITDRINDFQWDMITLRFSKDMPEFEKVGNIDVYRINGPKFLFPILACMRATKLHKKNNYDFIWSIMAAYAGFAALFFKWYSRIPFLLTLQEGDSEEHILRRVGIFYPLWKKIFKKADYIQVISNYLADFAGRYGAKCPIEIIPNGVDINRFKPQAPNLENKEEKILITTSRLVKKNAVGDIIEALKYLPENVKLLILGSGPDLEKLKKLAEEIEVDNTVKFLGYIKHEEMIKYLSRADIFVRPSLSEGLGSSFLEAMAVGLPIIATPVGGIPDFLKDGETGLFCEVRNSKSIAEKVKIYLENDDLRKKIVANAKEMVIRNYDWNLIAEKIKNIFNKLWRF